MQTAGHGAALNLLPVIATLVLLAQPFRLLAQTRVAVTSGVIQTQQHTMRYETFGDPSSPATIIVLHGASGPSIPFYQEQATFFASHGYLVLFPHYFDATTDHSPSDANYRAWVQAVTDLLIDQRSSSENNKRHFGLLGMSMGSSVALAAGSQGLPVQAIADWYGALPDSFFYNFKSMAPLLILHGEHDRNIPATNARQLQRLCQLKDLTCDSHLYPDQDHGFTGAALQDAQQRTLAFFAKHL
jgi:carboxymethylenebutenolidase